MKRFLRKIFVAILSITLFSASSFAPNFNLDSSGEVIGNYGSWVTEYNRNRIVGDLQHDATEFQAKYREAYEQNGVPIEARLGMVFMNALSKVVHVLDNSLIRFVNIFLVVAYFFWILIQGYRLATDGKLSAMPVSEDIIKKGILLGIWLLVLNGGFQELFGMLMGPVVALGAYISNIILDGVAAAGGFSMPDTCAAIKGYALANTSPDLIIKPEFAADIMCVPTRMSSFYYAAIEYGFKLFLSGIGHSGLAMIVGAILVFAFIVSAFKFAFLAFDVIADLFMIVITLPFTAIASTLNKTEYKGIIGQVYNGFLGIFSASSLKSQAMRFVNAAVYFVSLSIVVAIAGALLACSVEFDNTNRYVYYIVNSNVVTLMLVGAMVLYIAQHADEIAKTISGGVEYVADSKLSQDIKGLYNRGVKNAYDFIKKLRGK